MSAPTPGASPPPVACTLGADDLDDRLEHWRAALALVTDRTAIDDGLRLTFDPAVDIAELARLAEAEHACCAFLRFALTIDERGTALDVTAPEQAAPLVASLFGSTRGAEALGPTI